MTTVPLGINAFKRTFAQAPEVRMLNRFLEINPTNQVEGVSLLARPGTSFFKSFPSDLIRGFTSLTGSFNGDLFIFVGEQLMRFDGQTTIPITGIVAEGGVPSAAFMANPGLFEFLFVADGQQLQFYEGEGFARTTLQTSGPIISGDTVSIDNVFYRWTSGDVNAGTPLGTQTSPFLVALGVGGNATALDDLLKAINASGTPGFEYSNTITAPHTTVKADSSDAVLLNIKALTRGVAGNSITVTVQTGADLLWDAPTLEGGGSHILRGVPTPDDVGIVSLASIASFIIAVQSNSQKFFWINPGNTSIDPLDFASAEGSPDEIISVMTVGDEVWFFGQSTTESWFPTGNPDVPFQRTQGRAFSRGIVPGTAARVNQRILVVGNDGVVYAVGGGGIERVSTNSIEERIRFARQKENS